MLVGRRLLQIRRLLSLPLLSGAASPVSSLPLSLSRRRSYGRQPAHRPLTTQAHTTQRMQMAVHVQKPDVDTRAFRLVTLPNGLSVLLVSDPDADKAAAALDTHVGSLCDPPATLGLAHFCEHLLFMGTEKYPAENDYSQFLSAHGGHSNAFTAGDHTNYFFEVAADHLLPALDRFAQFFISPLFLESSTEREMNAVDSENKKNLQEDTWRLYQLEKFLSSPLHPYHQFATGNLETLKTMPISKGIDIRNVLLDFHAKYYSANIMKLVISGKEDLDTLQEWATSLFSKVANKNTPVPSFNGHPLTKKELSKIVYARPIKDHRIMELMFPLPDTSEHYESKPTRYLAHLLGHESGGSILSHLKNCGWANGLSAGATGAGSGFEFFKISVDLTQEGLENFESVTQVIFSYIDMMKAAGVQEWIFKEVESIAEMEFRFKEKSNPSNFVSKVAGQMHLYEKNPEHVISGPYLLWKYEPALIQDVWNCLNKDNFKITLISQSFGVDDKAGWATEPWYGTEHMVRDMEPEFVQSLSGKTFESLHLPKPNELIPSDFSVRVIPASSPAPRLIKNTALSRLWFKKDDTFFVPKLNAYFILRTPLAYASPKFSILTRMYNELVKDALIEFAYYAEVGGIGYHLDNQTDGLVMQFEGFNHKLPSLVTTVLEKLVAFQISTERFELVKEQVLRQLKNFDLDAPYHHAMYYFSYMTQEKLWSHEEKIVELERMTAEDVKAFAPSLLESLFIEGLVHGNIEEAGALNLLKLVEEIVAPRPISPLAHMSPRSILMPRESRYVYVRPSKDAGQLNSSIEYYMQVGTVMDIRLRGTLLLFSQIFHEPAFDQLRTKEQLGYIVFSGVRKQCGVMGYRVIVQSEKAPAFLEFRIENFLTSVEGKLAALSPEEFSNHVAALKTKLLEKPKNLGQEAHRHYSQFSTGFFDFAQDAVDAVTIESLAMSDLVSFYHTFISPASPTLKKLAIHIPSTQALSEEEKNAESWLWKRNERVEDVVLWKSQMNLAPAPRPVHSLESFMAPAKL